MLTIGQLAESAGISEKALRIYEKKGLIHSVRNAENNYRYYEEKEKETLQKIVMFKFLGFSLDQIHEFLEKGKELSMEESLTQQKTILEQRRKQLDTVIHCMDKAITDCHTKTLNVDELLDKLKLITKNCTADENFWELKKYSDKTLEWNPWIFEQAEMREGLTILDAGAGYGNLWRLNQKRMPRNCRVTCIDVHNTWADDFEKYVREETVKGNYTEGTFDFLWGDMEEMELSGTYDRIFLNHVIPFLKDGKAMCRRLRECLREDGIFISTFGGIIFWDEVERLLVDFAKHAGSEQEKLVREVQKINKRRKASVLEKVSMIQDIFPVTELRRYEIELSFDEKDCYDFLGQSYKDVKSELEKSQNVLLKYLKQIREKTGMITLKRDTYLMYCKK